MASPIGRDELRRHTTRVWPQPGRGDTRARWSDLTALGRLDLPLAKLVEPHHDALAIRADLGLPPAGPDDIWAVWAAEPPFAVLTATESGAGWTVTGSKAFCSGADLATHALVTASTPSGSRLMAVDLADPDIAPSPSGARWVGPGMIRSRTVTVEFDDVRAQAVGAPGDYTDRAGFWWGAIGIAAIWLGGAAGVGDTLERSSDRLDPHGTAHLGAVRADLEGLSLMLDGVARLADDGCSTAEAQRLALVVRERASAVVDSVVARVGRALGPGPLAFDADHAERVADLQVFVRQHHAERDLEQLGAWGRADG